ncbi:hypothetical protein CN645_30405 [Burkholderia sp. IDO3]|nr:hypothetical protein DCN14_01710 [Burkholderia sp. IDO3]PCD58197.1 hypothetical protein CN645_30405 [Burkholderia sp. IDO3]
MNSLQPVFPQNKRSLVTRAPSDNALLASCNELHGYVAKGSAVAMACGAAIGCVWFLCVAFRAGALTWPF